MPSLTLAGLALPPHVVAAVASLLLAMAAARLASWKQRADVVGLACDIACCGLVAARAAFVLAWLPTYAAQPLAILDIRDGGFSAWAGLAAALARSAWLAWRQRTLAVPLAAGWVAAVAAWSLFALAAAGDTAQRRLPAMPLQTFDQRSVTLAELAGGKPAVVNLWASWCGPCRREMPALQEAQRQHPDLAFIFVNQDREQQAARDFLQQGRLQLDKLAADPQGAVARAVGTSVYPTTLFYAADGRLLAVHVGGFSTASLGAALENFRAKLR